ncbi:MAG: hypothetical protein L6437_14850 [Kiritimatiellae bacterium]|nr:hypothetical protein [Kiritimatiellia bacterium]
MKLARCRTLIRIALAVVFAESVVATQAANWSATPLAKWTESVTLEGSDTLNPPYGKWEETAGTLTATGLVARWSTMLAPGDQGANQKVSIRFAVQQSSGAPFSLPGGCVRWSFYWGENNPGWDFGVVLRFKDALNFYRVQVSATRGQLALWDSTGGFLQIVPCAIKTNAPYTLEITARGAHFQAVVDGAPVMDYWDRTLPHAAGQVGLAAYRSTVRVESFQVEKVAADATPMPPHQPNFRFDTSRGVVLYDGNEPISLFGVKNSRLGQGAVKLKPGWRPAYYSPFGPTISSKWMPLVGKLPEALKVEGGGETITYRFQTELPNLTHADHVCTVRFDAGRGVYRYEFRGKLVFLGEGKSLSESFEWLDPLCYNNREPGPEVVHRWNWAGHRWHVFQGPGNEWLRYPLVDYNTCNNQEMNWGKFSDFLYPDPAVCPAFETEIGWPQPKGRYFKIGQCTWGYDYHHAEVGSSIDIPAGTERPLTMTWTGLLPEEAKKIYDQSRPAPDVARETARLAAFDPRGTSFTRTGTLADFPGTMVWGGGIVDETVGHTDRASFLIDGPGNANVYMYQYIFEQYAKRWWVRGWFKTKGVRGRGLELRVKYTYQPQPQDLFYLGGLGDKDWTQFSFITTAPHCRDCTSMAFELDGPGQVWLDDVAFSALKDDDNPKVTSFPMPPGLEPSKEILIDLPMAEQPDKAVYDESRNGHALFLTNVTWMQQDGRGYLHFNGTNASARVNFTPVLQGLDRPPEITESVLAQYGVPFEGYKPIFPPKQFTYEWWARLEKPAKDPGLMVMFHSRLNPICGFNHLFEKDGECRLSYQGDIFCGAKIRLEQAVPYNQWLHLAITHGDGKVVLYVNGQKSAEADYDPKGPGFWMNKWRLDFGLWMGKEGRGFCGDLGPFRLYVKALTDAEVAERYRSGWPSRKP